MSGRRDDRRDDAPVFEFRPRAVQRQDGARSEPVALADLLVPALSRLGLRTRARQVQVTLAWPAVVGPMVAGETAIVAFSRGVVTVETSSPALSHQLRMQQNDIVERLNLKLGDQAVRSLRFRIAISAQPLAPRPPRTPAPPPGGATGKVDTDRVD